MATKPTPAAANPNFGMHLLTFQNLGWSTHLLVPSAKLNELAALLSLCTVVESSYMPEGITLLSQLGDPEYALTSLTRRLLIAPSKEKGAAFEAYYKATFELTPKDDRPPSGTPLLTYAEWVELEKNLDPADTHTSKES